MDTASQWPQDMVVKTMENMAASHGKPPLAPASGGLEERKSRPHKEEALNCPRCNSTNTKFCYYNNYSLSQPRYFCKTCRRYWTHGGSLRNIPVGGGSRKNKRPYSSSSSTSSRNIKLPDLQVLPPHHHHHNHHQNPKNQDLDLGFSIHHHNYDDFKSLTEMIQASDFSLDGGARPEIRLLQNPNSATGYPYVPPLMTAVTGAEISTSPAFPHLPEFKLSNSLNFSLDHGLGGSNYEGLPASESKVLFPFEELKQDDGSSKGNNNNNNDINIDNNGSEEGGGHQENGDGNRGYWNGVLGGGSW